VALLARAHQNVRRQRADFHHKVALQLVQQYDTISHEDVQTANMVKNHHLAKSITDAGGLPHHPDQQGSMRRSQDRCRQSCVSLANL
jgi:hypothetical protein